MPTIPDPPCPDPDREIIRYDADGWISGPSVRTELAAAKELQPGQVVLHDDGTLAAIVASVPCTVRFPGGGDGPGVALWWQQRGGTASGVMVRTDADTLALVTR